jgi:hypothetical protein
VSERLDFFFLSMIMMEEQQKKFDNHPLALVYLVRRC